MLGGGGGTQGEGNAGGPDWEWGRPCSGARTGVGVGAGNAFPPVQDLPYSQGCQGWWLGAGLLLSEGVQLHPASSAHGAWWTSAWPGSALGKNSGVMPGCSSWQGLSYIVVETATDQGSPSC